jgi:hypothetical protein
VRELVEASLSRARAALAGRRARRGLAMGNYLKRESPSSRVIAVIAEIGNRMIEGPCDRPRDCAASSGDLVSPRPDPGDFLPGAVFDAD